MKKVIVESHVPFLEGAFDGVAETVVLAPEDIDREAVADADALIVRTRTRCDEALLGGSRVRFVGTATIGTDHFDLPWLASAGIEAVNAPGCNAPAVAQYVLASILSLKERLWGPQTANKDLTVGIVGVGHVGSIVAFWCRQLGFRTLLCDPPRAEAEKLQSYRPLADIAREADIVTLHTPHTRPPFPHATHHLADAPFFSSLKRKPLFINAARGPVADNEALIAAIDSGQVRGAVIDCWEGEPAISRALLDRALIATPHIAGYSLEGKKRAAQTVGNALLRHFGSDRRIDLGIPEGPVAYPTPEAILDSYNPFDDTAAMRAALDADPAPATFERLRNTYPLRHEVGIIP